MERPYRIKDYIGKRFNSLIVESFVERKDGKTLWNCKCDCGNNKIVSTISLLKNVKDCGCGIGKATNKIDLTGQKFNKLTVIEEDGRNNHGEVMWKCKCDCGNIVSINGYALRKGHVKSCGCYRVERAIEANKKYNNYDLSGDYGVGISSNGYEFIFDIEDYDKIKDYCWSVDYYGYLMSRDKGKTIKMHRIIMGIHDSNIFVDHINHNKLDNRKS